MLEQFVNFSELSYFFGNFQPLTPYGVDQKAAMNLFSTTKELNSEFDLIELFIDFLSSKEDAVAKIESRLKRITMLDFLQNDKYDSSDIFLVKKFLINYKAIFDILSDNLISELSAFYDSNELLKKLNIDSSNEETFYISDKYDSKLAKVRKEVKDVGEKLKKLKSTRINEIKEKHGLDFEGKDFLVIDEKESVNLSKELFYFEPYDTQYLVAKPVFQGNYHKLRVEIDKLIQKEKKIESEIIEKLSKSIFSEKQNLTMYIHFVERIDTLLAKAKLSVTFNMVRPAVQKYGSKIKIKDGRFIPLLELCEKLETNYCPINVDLEGKDIVIRGANMGGKTVLLKSVAFLQLLTQLGHFVPASSFSTVLFESFCYIGSENMETQEGLSSFGLDIHQFNSAFSVKGNKALFIFDEFARTTNSREGLALTASILSEFCEDKNIYSFLATHFMDLPEIKGLSKYCMKGLNLDKFKDIYNNKSSDNLKDRLKMINQCMDYNVVHDSDNMAQDDALKIAYLLGLDKNIIKNAENFLGENND